MKKIILIAIGILLISLVGAVESANVKIDIFADVKVSPAYDDEYQTYYDAPSQVDILGRTFQKTNLEVGNIFINNTATPDLAYFIVVKGIGRQGVAFTGYVPVFDFEEDIENMTKNIEFVVPSLNVIRIEIYYKNVLKDTIILPNKLCSINGKCDASEDYFSCPSDCPASSLDGACVLNYTGNCDPDCSIWDSRCTASDLCDNSILDSGEQGIDCGGSCNKVCTYTDTDLDLLLKQYDASAIYSKGASDTLLGVDSILAQGFGFTTFFH